MSLCVLSHSDHGFMKLEFLVKRFVCVCALRITVHKEVLYWKIAQQNKNWTERKNALVATGGKRN